MPDLLKTLSKNDNYSQTEECPVNVKHLNNTSNIVYILPFFVCERVTFDNFAF